MLPPQAFAFALGAAGMSSPGIRVTSSHHSGVSNSFKGFLEILNTASYLPSVLLSALLMFSWHYQVTDNYLLIVCSPTYKTVSPMKSPIVSHPSGGKKMREGENRVSGNYKKKKGNTHHTTIDNNI